MLTPQQCFEICGHYLTPGHFSNRAFKTISSDGENFDKLEDDYYLSLAGDLYELPKNARSDGLSAPTIAALAGRGHGGDDWAAGWFHDGCYQNWLLKWTGAGWEKANFTQAQSDPMLKETAMACGDTEAEADVLMWAVMGFGRRAFNEDRGLAPQQVLK